MYTFIPPFAPRNFTPLEPLEYAARKSGMLATWLDTFNGEVTLHIRRCYVNAQGAYGPTVRGVNFTIPDAPPALATVLALIGHTVHAPRATTLPQPAPAATVTMPQLATVHAG